MFAIKYIIYWVIKEMPQLHRHISFYTKIILAIFWLGFRTCEPRFTGFSIPAIPLFMTVHCLVYFICSLNKQKLFLKALFLSERTFFRYLKLCTSPLAEKVSFPILFIKRINALANHCRPYHKGLAVENQTTAQKGGEEMQYKKISAENPQLSVTLPIILCSTYSGCLG